MSGTRLACNRPLRVVSWDKVSLGACLPCVLVEMEQRALVVAGFHLAAGPCRSG